MSDINTVEVIGIPTASLCSKGKSHESCDECDDFVACVIEAGNKAEQAFTPEHKIIPQELHSEIRVVLQEGAKVPVYATAGANAADLFANLPEGPLHVLPGTTVKVPTGVRIQLPPNIAALIFPRSGMSYKTPLRLANSVGLIDTDYRGEIQVLMDHKIPDMDNPEYAYTINHGDRIAQILFIYAPQAKFVEVTTLDPTVRDEGGMGSTGK